MSKGWPPPKSGQTTKGIWPTNRSSLGKSAGEMDVAITPSANTHSRNIGKKGSSKK